MSISTADSVVEASSVRAKKAVWLYRVLGAVTDKAPARVGVRTVFVGFDRSTEVAASTFVASLFAAVTAGAIWLQKRRGRLARAQHYQC